MQQTHHLISWPLILYFLAIETATAMDKSWAEDVFMVETCVYKDEEHKDPKFSEWLSSKQLKETED